MDFPVSTLIKISHRLYRLAARAAHIIAHVARLRRLRGITQRVVACLGGHAVVTRISPGSRRSRRTAFERKRRMPLRPAAPTATERRQTELGDHCIVMRGRAYLRSWRAPSVQYAAQSCVVFAFLRADLLRDIRRALMKIFQAFGDHRQQLMRPKRLAEAFYCAELRCHRQTRDGDDAERKTIPDITTIGRLGFS